MAALTRFLAPAFAVAPQLSAEDVADVRAQGFKTLINNRPDGEGCDGQPLNRDIEAAARAAGLSYLYLPVVSGAITPAQALTLREALAAAPTPVLAFCRSGARSAQLYHLAQAEG